MKIILTKKEMEEAYEDYVKSYFNTHKEVVVVDMSKGIIQTAEELEPLEPF